MGKHGPIWYFNLAKVGVEGSNPFARSILFMSSPKTWVTDRTGDMGDNLVPIGLSMIAMLQVRYR